MDCGAITVSFKRLVLLFSLKDIILLQQRFLNNHLGGLSSEYGVIFIDVWFSIYVGVTIKNITFQLDFHVKKWIDNT